MAVDLRERPILKDKNAKNFLKRLAENERSREKLKAEAKRNWESQQNENRD
ncbi:hypothetical protein [Planococcus lenghuensis]|uniref:hypothetical protein n=1 Tax=Planococcus lenghuensis TaxID=2213202 RepID=UPI0012EC52F8|nr:hypothetical protein [Planococcus lenghuensis]